MTGLSQEFMIEKAHSIFRSKGGIGPKRVLPAKVHRLTQKCFAVEGSCRGPLMEVCCAVVMLDGQALESCVVTQVIKELEGTGLCRDIYMRAGLFCGQDHPREKQTCSRCWEFSAGTV